MGSLVTQRRRQSYRRICARFAQIHPVWLKVVEHLLQSISLDVSIPQPSVTGYSLSLSIDLSRVTRATSVLSEERLRYLCAASNG
jgi:hypothetical protein